ncbi:hypothetical protein DENSPDRAFT_875836 [Dentipellis sp. KUC8613]|nr:hypothetical protein DENSPDRAFT_875836 [Dentipellis sp. KUC8613]
MSVSNAEAGPSTSLTLSPYLADPPELRLHPRALPPHITFTKQIVPLSELPPDYPFYQIRTRLGKFVLGWYEFSSAVELSGSPDSELARAGDIYIDRHGCRVWICYAAAGHEWKLWEGNALVKAGLCGRHPMFPLTERRWSYLMWFTGTSFLWSQHIAVISRAGRWTSDSVGGAWICERYPLEKRESTVSFGSPRDVIEMWEDANQFPRVERSRSVGERKDITSWAAENNHTPLSPKVQGKARRSQAVFGTAESLTRRDRAPSEILASVINSVHDRNQRGTRISRKNEQPFKTPKAVKRAVHRSQETPSLPGPPFNRSSAPSPSHGELSSPLSDNSATSTPLRDISTLPSNSSNRRHILPQLRVSTSMSSERSLRRSRELSYFGHSPTTHERTVVSKVKSVSPSPLLGLPGLHASSASLSRLEPSPLSSSPLASHTRLSPELGLSSAVLRIREPTEPTTNDFARKYESSLTPTLELESIVSASQIESASHHTPSLPHHLDTMTSTPQLPDRRVAPLDFMITDLSPLHDIAPVQSPLTSLPRELSTPPTAAQITSTSPITPLPTHETSVLLRSSRDREQSTPNFSPEESPSSGDAVASFTTARIPIRFEVDPSSSARAERQVRDMFIWLIRLPIDERRPSQENRGPTIFICTRCVADGVAQTCHIESNGQRCQRCRDRHFKCSNTRDLGKRKRELGVGSWPQLAGGGTRAKRRRLDPVVREMARLGRSVGSAGARGGERVLRSKMSVVHASAVRSGSRKAARVREKIQERVADQLANRRRSMMRVIPEVRRSIHLTSSSKQHVTPRWKPARNMNVIGPGRRSVAPPLRRVERKDERQTPSAGAQGRAASLEQLAEDDDVIENILMEEGRTQEDIHRNDDESSVADVPGQRVESPGQNGVQHTSETAPPNTPSVVKPVGWAAMKDRMVYIERTMVELVGALRDLRRDMDRL